jgi:flagellar assembly protein FliH
MSTSCSDERTSIERTAIRFAYPQIGYHKAKHAEEDHQPVEKCSGPSPAEIETMVRRARAEAEAQTDRRIRQEFEDRSKCEAARITQALEAFSKERNEYFARVESQIVHLALSIAAKILHREAQVDPTLVAALVRLAVENMSSRSNVTVRVRPQEVAHWRKCLNDAANGSNGPVISVVEDPALESGACVLETQMGSADFNIEAQLKEVERGFLDLLAQRPSV